MTTVVTCDGNHYCPSCKPDWFARPESREGEHHFAVRFGDARKFNVLDQAGDPVRGVVELWVGMVGRMTRSYVLNRDAAGNYHKCSCSQGVCTSVFYAQLRVVSAGQKSETEQGIENGTDN